MALSKRRKGIAQKVESESDSSAAELSEEEPMLEDDSEEESSPKRSRQDDEDVEESDVEEEEEESVADEDEEEGDEDENEEEDGEDVEEEADEESDIEEGEDEEADDIEDEEEGNVKDKEEVEEKLLGNAGWADAISKVLRTNKPKKKKTLVLSRAKKLTELTLKEEPADPGFEIDGKLEPVETDVKEEKPDIKPILSASEMREHKRKRKMWETMSRTKPDILAKDRERVLAKVATRGVIQLFNAVRKQQKEIESGFEEAGASERKREKVLKSVDKNSFLDILMGPTKSVHVGRTVKPEQKKEEEESEKAPLWSVLRDDFMMGDGNLKDWDKEQEADEDNSDEGESLDEDSS